MITIETLGQVEQAEAAVRQLGFHELRVRHHDQVARVEIPPADFQTAIEQSQAIVEAIKATGYNYVALDLAGFRSGSMNDVLADSKPQTTEKS